MKLKIPTVIILCILLVLLHYGSKLKWHVNYCLIIILLHLSISSRKYYSFKDQWIRRYSWEVVWIDDLLSRVFWSHWSSHQDLFILLPLTVLVCLGLPADSLLSSFCPPQQLPLQVSYLNIERYEDIIVSVKPWPPPPPPLLF